MRAFLASPLGFLVGLSLGVFGAGGSILAVPALVHAAGQTPQAATSTSLLLVGSAALVGMVAHHRAGRVRVGTGVMFGLVGIGGAVAGTSVNRHLDPDLLLLGFSGLIVIAIWRMLVGCPTCTRVGERRALLRPAHRGGRVAVLTRVDVGLALEIVAAGTIIGFLAGLFGVGGGFLILPALTLLLKLDMPAAVGTSLLVIAINAATGIATRLATSTIAWETALPFTVAAIIGALYGNRIADELDAERSVRRFALLLTGVAVYTATRAAVALA